MAGDPLPVRLRALVLPGALLAAAALVVVLGMQLRTARAELRLSRQRALFPTTGQVVPPVRARTLDGDSALLGEGPRGTHQVLFVYNTTCSLCVETLPAWIRITGRLSGDRDVAVLGWSQDADSLTRAYVTHHGLPFPTVANIPHKYLQLYHAQGVPATLVLDPDGRVVYGRPGVLSPMAEDSVVMAAR